MAKTSYTSKNPALSLNQIVLCGSRSEDVICVEDVIEVSSESDSSKRDLLSPKIAVPAKDTSKLNEDPLTMITPELDYARIHFHWTNEDAKVLNIAYLFDPKEPKKIDNYTALRNVDTVEDKLNSEEKNEGAKKQQRKSAKERGTISGKDFLDTEAKETGMKATDNSTGETDKVEEDECEDDGFIVDSPDEENKGRRKRSRKRRHHPKSDAREATSDEESNGNTRSKAVQDQDKNRPHKPQTVSVRKRVAVAESSSGAEGETCDDNIAEGKTRNVEHAGDSASAEASTTSDTKLSNTHSRVRTTFDDSTPLAYLRSSATADDAVKIQFNDHENSYTFDKMGNE